MLLHAEANGRRFKHIFPLALVIECMNIFYHHKFLFMHNLTSEFKIIIKIFGKYHYFELTIIQYVYKIAWKSHVLVALDRMVLEMQWH